MTEVWMVRHTSVDVPAGTCYGRSDVPLAGSFEREAAAVREALAGEGDESEKCRTRTKSAREVNFKQPPSFDAVFSSPLSRCTRLAEACGYGSAVRDERLLELDFGAWEGQPFEGIDDPALQLWYDDYLHARPTGGETFDEQRARVADFLEELRSGVHRRVLVFTHGGVMVAAGIHAGLFTAEDAFSHIPPHGGIIKIVYGTSGS